jgi:membrane-associated phospholipid phosphatase
MTAPEAFTSRWRMAVQSLNRPYPVSIPMVVLVSLVPAYIFIAEWVRGRTLHVPALAVDRMVPLQPNWALLYGAMYLFLIALPIFVVRQPEHIRRTVLAYLTIWVIAYVCFLVYPTIGPRPTKVIGTGFGVWGLRLLYAADPSYNCFPSLHVAHSFVSAFTCYRVHRKVGLGAMFAALFVALSTLFTKQHYVLDVIAGILLAGLAYFAYLRNHPAEEIPEMDRRVAPVFAMALLAATSVGIAGFWVAYLIRGGA